MHSQDRRFTDRSEQWSGPAAPLPQLVSKENAARRSLTASDDASWHVQNEGVIDCTKIVRIGGDDVQVPLPRAEGNRDIDHIGVARPATQEADRAGDRVVQGDDLRALVAEQRGDPRLSRSAAPRLSNGTRGHRDLPVTPVDLL